MSTLQKTKPRIERNRVLVTGGAGFVGSHLCTFLVQRGDHVRHSFSKSVIITRSCVVSKARDLLV